MEYLNQALNLFNFFLDHLSSLSLILIFIISIFFIHLILFFIRDRKYAKPFKKYRDPESISLTELHENPLVNIIMPAWKEGETFRHALKSITNLTYPKIRVIVNAGGNEETIKIAESFRKYENFTILHQDKGGGKIKAINDCLPFVNEGVVYSVDADVYLTDETLIRLLFPITNLNEHVSTSGHRPLPHQENKDFVKYLIINQNYSFRLKFERYGVGGISGTNTMMTLDAIKAIGKFREDRLIATDRSRGYDLLEKGFKIYCLCDYRGLIHSDIPDTIKEFSARRIRWIENHLIYASETGKRKDIMAFLILFLSSLYLLIFPVLIFLHFTLFLLGLYILLSKYLKRLRRILFFKITRQQQIHANLSILFYIKMIGYIFLEAIINVYTFFEFYLNRKKFKKRRNIYRETT